MTITAQMTQRGKVIHLVAASDLIEAVQYGERWRAYCPIHGSDHQRSLSIDLATGWGFCHNCHATVLVQPMASVITKGQENMYGQWNAHASAFGDKASAEHLRPLLRPYQVRGDRSASPFPHWQREEGAALLAVAPLVRKALASSRRAQRYLNERGIPPAIALATGVGYLSRAAWEQALVSKEQQPLLKRWIGRIIFPLGSPAGQGFIGRTLLQWEPGMDENAHKTLLEVPGAPKRWLKTSPAGWFGFDSSGLCAERVVLVEGGFDRLALLAAGLPASNVIALVGTAARPWWLTRTAPQIKGVVLALDADNGGVQAMERLGDAFRQAGFVVSHCSPPHDRWGKDWSERWRRLGPQSLWPLYEALAHHGTAQDERKDP